MKKLNKLSKEERKTKIKKFIQAVYIDINKSMKPWQKLTEQTVLVPTGYYGQTLVSLVTGIKGKATAARGDDLADGSEVKTCSRYQQLNNCRDCKERVASIYNSCSVCGSENIKIMKDSHWICSINKNNYKQYKVKIPVIYFLLVDTHDLKKNQLVRFTIWTIKPKENMIWQKNYVDNYYKKYKQNKIKGNTPAPMNVHPRSPKFNSINPKIKFEAILSKNGKVSILNFTPYALKNKTKITKKKRRK
jgi:hypothetical protein